MNQVITKKKRLKDKKQELQETWDDIRTFISQYLEKLNCVVDTVLTENDSVPFFQTYPKVSSHVDMILNIFLQVQCEFSLLSCEKFLNNEVSGVHCLTKNEAPVEPTTLREVNKEHMKVSDSADLPVIQVGDEEKAEDSAESEDYSGKVCHLEHVSSGALGEELSDAAVELCTAAEDAEVDFCTHNAVNVNDAEEPIAERVPRVSSVETPVCEIGEDLTESSEFTPSKKRISHYVIKPNEVLEMVYSHGDNPWNFWLCYYPCSDIKFVQDRISSMYYANRLEALSALPDVGDYVLVADGDRFLRGQVLTVRGTELSDIACFMLLDVDSGRMKSFKLRHVWKIPEELLSIQAQAVNCQLEDIEGDSILWRKENLRKCQMDRKFEELLLRTTLSVKFIKTVGDSSLPRYIIDADCLDLETDKIYNVSQLINKEIIPAITHKPRVEECSHEDESFILQNSSVTSLSRHCEVKDTLMNVTQQEKDDANEISERIVSEACEVSAGCVVGVGNLQDMYGNSEDDMYKEQNYPSYHCLPRTRSPPLCVVDFQKVSDPDNAEIMSLCETSYSDVILDLEDTLDDHIDGDIEQASNFTATEVPSNEKSECKSSVISSIYCERDIILEKLNYSHLLNKTVLAIPTFVDSPSLFHMQIFLDENDEFTALHEKMSIFYAENKIKFSTKDELQKVIKSYCVTMHPQDRQWYRGEIIDWMPLAETSVCVCFVDIGDKMVIELDFVQPLAKQFAKVPVLSQKCHLYGVGPVECAMYSYVSYEWSAFSLSEFRCVLNLDCVFNMEVKELTSYGSLGVLLVDPASPEVSVNKKLITLGEAKCLLSEENLSLWDPMKEEFERYTQNSYDDENACKAVTGYSPNDEQRFCKFYARDGRCFKGSNCRKEHVLSHPGGWISDKEEVFQEAFSQIVLPEVGETVYIQVTCVVRINLFYIILNVDDNPDEETLLTLNKYINDKDNLKNLRKLEVTPAVGQLVLAHYRLDGIWYRARVIDTDNDNNLVQVFFVDYGNTEWVSEIFVRDIDPQYLHLPFQAIESSLAFAEMNASVDDDSLQKVISAFRSLTDCTQPLRAKIISKDDVLKKLELQLFDVNDQDITLMLADTGYVSITSIQMTPATAFAIPG